MSPPSGGAPWSPFLSVYEQVEGEAPFEDPVREAYVTVVQELYDEEFDESLFELLTDARNLHSDHLAVRPFTGRRRSPRRAALLRSDS